MQRKVSPDVGMDRSGSFEDDSIRRLRRDEGEAAMDMEFRSLSFVVLKDAFSLNSPCDVGFFVSRHFVSWGW